MRAAWAAISDAVAAGANSRGPGGAMRTARA